MCLIIFSKQRHFLDLNEHTLKKMSTFFLYSFITLKQFLLYTDVDQ